MRIIYDTVKTCKTFISKEKEKITLHNSINSTMKKNLFTKLLALFLCGALLTTVGCKDYDDDINGINDRLDKIEVKLPEITKQIESVQKSIPDLTELNKAVADLKADLKTFDNLKQEVERLQGIVDGLDFEDRIAALEAYVSDLKNASSGHTFAELFETIGLTKQLEEALEKLNGDATVDGSIKNQIQPILDKIAQTLDNAEWLDGEIASYLNEMEFPYVDAVGAVDAVYEAISDENHAAHDKYKEAIQALVDGAVTGFVKVADLEAAKTEYRKLIAKLEGRVLALEGRIQSLVYVPASLEEMDVIAVQGSSYIAMKDKQNNDYPFVLSNSKGQIEITFLVAPAALATQMNKEVCSLVTKQIKIAATRAAQPQFVIDTIILDKEQPGEFTVVASTDYDFAEGAMDNKTLAVALNVKIGNPNDVAAEGETPAQNYQGIDYTTDFIGTMYVNGEKINDRLIVARPATADVQGDNLTATGANDVFAPEGLVYTDTETVRSFFAEYDLYYQDEDFKLHAIADMGWDNFPTFKRNVTDKPTVSVTDHAANYDLSKAESVQIKTSDKKLVNDDITSGKFTFTLESGDYACTLVEEATQMIAVLAERKTITATPYRDGGKVTWNYAAYNTSTDHVVKYSLNPDPNKPQISKAIYEAMQASGINDLKTYKDGKEVGDPLTLLGCELTTIDPTDDRTEQFAEITLSYDSELPTGKYTIKAFYSINDGADEYVIEIPIEVVGLPELVFAPVTKEVTYVVGTFAYDVVADYGKELWKQNSAALAGHFADEAEFLAALADNSTFPAEPASATDGTKLALGGVNDANIQIVLSSSAPKLASKYELGAAIEFIWNWAVDVDATVSVKIPGGTLEHGDNYPASGKVEMSSVLTGSGYNTAAKSLNHIFISELAENGGEIHFEVIEADENNPSGITISGIGDAATIDWNGATVLSTEVKATLVYGTYTIDEETFTVYVVDPIADKNITWKSAAVKKVEATTTDVPYDLSQQLQLMTIKLDNGASAAQNVFTWGDLASIGGTITYENLTPGLTKDRIELAGDFATTGKLIVKGATDTEFATPKTVKIRVSYKDDYRKDPIVNEFEITVEQKK